MDILNQILDTTLNSFDFAFCAVVNILTYVIIKTIEDITHKTKLNRWIKRVILLAAIVVVGVVYYLTDSDIKLLMNSAILAPVFWSWIAKPICSKLKVDYKRSVSEDEDNNEL